jgi:polyferredoxin
MVFSFPHHPVLYPFHTLRGWLVQPFFWAVMLLSPLFGVFRLDVIHQCLVVWGHTYPFSSTVLKWVPLGFFTVVLVIAAISVFWGRLFCGWVCPHNTLTEWTQPVRMLMGIGYPKSYRLRRRETMMPLGQWVHRGLSLLWALLITALISVLFIGYFVPFRWWIVQIADGTLPMVIYWSHGVLIVMGLFFLYAGHEFCRSACPYGLAQSLSAYLSRKWAPMEIRFLPGADTSPCKGCRACQTACPVAIDPRQPENLVVGIGEGCFNCGECIDACRYVRKGRDLPGLLTFQPPTWQSGAVMRDISE